MITILGIDPGSRITGYGLIQTTGSRHTYIASGCVITKSKDLAQKLGHIFADISEIIRVHRPQELAIEQVFVEKNVNSALKLGQARGAAIVAAASHCIPVIEYSARRVKQSVTGHGAADKTQVQHMVKCLLNLSGYPAVDAADALAVALCHANSRQFSLKAKITE